MMGKIDGIVVWEMFVVGNGIGGLGKILTKIQPSKH